MDAITLLVEDHRKVEDLISQYASLSDRTDKIRIFAQISEALNVHAAFEELHFYPAYQQATQDKELIRTAFEEHQELKDCLKKFQPALSDAEMDSLIQGLKQVLEEHVHEEETEMFPKAREALGDARLKALGTEYREAKPNLEQQVSLTIMMLADAAIKTTEEARR